jgi:hypothetical protein
MKPITCLSCRDQIFYGWVQSAMDLWIDTDNIRLIVTLLELHQENRDKITELPGVGRRDIVDQWVNTDYIYRCFRSIPSIMSLA